MATIKNNSDLVHAFAQRQSISGRCGNLFYERNKIYSYGYHYLLGEFYDNQNETFILINDKGYSSSTAKHISLLKQATKHYKQYLTSEVNLYQVKIKIEALNNKLKKAKKPYLYVPQILETYNKFLNNPFSIDFSDNNYIYIKNIVDGLPDVADVLENIKKIEAKKADAQQKKLLKQIEKFYNYEIDYLKIENDLLRISKDGLFVETSQRVRIPISEAKQLYKAIIKGEDVKGYKIGSFKVDSLNGSLKVGCHNISMDEVHRIGNLIK